MADGQSDRFRPDAALLPLMPPDMRAELGAPRHGWGECRCWDCAPEAWVGVDRFAFSAMLASAAEAEGALTGAY